MQKIHNKHTTLQSLCLHNIQFSFSSNKRESKNKKGAQKKIIDHFSLQTEQGDIIALLGRSGSGKSTLLRIIAGLLEPQQGTIVLNNTPFRHRLGKVGYMPQQDMLFPWLTITHNIALPLQIQKYSKAQSQSIAQSLLKEFDLHSYAHAYPQQLSGGMCQRISLLRSLVSRNSIVLLDEPFSHLDYFNRYECLSWSKKVLKKMQPIVLYVSHDIDEALAFATRILVVSNNTMTILYDTQLKHTTHNTEQIKQSIISLLAQDTST